MLPPSTGVYPNPPSSKPRSAPELMTAVDFEKAFDSLNWNFPLKSLEYFSLASGNPSWGGLERFATIYQVVLSIMVFPLPLPFLKGVFARATRSRHLFS